ncbi:hypothetical protein HDK90DRAFT_302594 [Phyllosticta capitalensis]|uniref:Uncharacterized protein n=1 Tax=Phyllosticta capitalensis TaxID=121624 RepID=A0ABR1YKB3_9PEZI
MSWSRRISDERLEPGRRSRPSKKVGKRRWNQSEDVHQTVFHFPCCRRRRRQRRAASSDRCVCMIWMRCCVIFLSFATVPLPPHCHHGQSLVYVFLLHVPTLVMLLQMELDRVEWKLCWVDFAEEGPCSSFVM